MSFSACELCVLAIAPLRKASALKVLEVVPQILITKNQLGGLLDRVTMRVLLTKLTLVEAY